ncbi:cytochrome P450 [Hesseltinella vesiculosa]|uniref:NADPH--hemoprotein reductase n=1 Tax=Hesseltinella vesiculosa TaxID=101127 RepID=A0A1X2GR80_9FUNG|nr:cytochrome P450 [Hesseltinella vesiculosa]
MPIIENNDIPGPPPHAIFGNSPDLMPDILGNIPKLHKKYGPVMKLVLDSHVTVSINDPDGLQQTCLENENFTKNIVSVYTDLAILNGRGLVTTSTVDHDWVLAHKLLMPAFSARSMRTYNDSMGHCIGDLIKVMESFEKSGELFDVGRWMISLALESIGRVGFDFDFGTLRDPKAPRHPFTVALNYVQTAIMKRASSPYWFKWYETFSPRFARDLALLRNTVSDVLSDRKAKPHGEGDEKDLLDFMLHAQTKEGEKLDDALIRDEIITLLSAGHNTTSSLLSWTILELCRNPEVAKKIVQEIVDMGIKPGDVPPPELANKCTYLDAVLKESLRLHSPIFGVPRYCKKDCTIKVKGNEYKVLQGQLAQVQISGVHKNPEYWPNPNVFDPERFTDPEVNANRHPNAFMPFNDGPRACIGRQFALQEARLALIMMLSRFRFEMDDPNEHINYAIVIAVKALNLNPPTPAKIPLPKATFLYGTQTGTSEEYARKLSVQAKQFGIEDVTVCELDEWKAVKGEKVGGVDNGSVQADGDMKISELVVVITATYNGYPPDDAVAFDQWLVEKTEAAEKSPDNILEGCLYAVFGCGNKQWASTFQKFPKKVNDGLDLLGADKLLPPGVGDANDDIDGDFASWTSEFWSALMQRFGQELSGKNADIMTDVGPVTNPTDEFTLTFLSQAKDREAFTNASKNKHLFDTFGMIVVNDELQCVDKSKRSTRHIEVAFEPATDGKPLYEAGDHLEIMPVNDPELVEEIALNLGFALDSVFEVTDLEMSSLSPRSMAANIKGPCTIRNALTYYADLTGTPTRYTLSALGKELAKRRPDIADRLQKQLLVPGTDTTRLKEFLRTHRTFLDVMRAMEIKELDWKEFIGTLNCIVPRKYSISSGPLEHPTQPSVSVGVVHDHGGEDGKQSYYGLCSGYLANLKPGVKINAQIKECKSTFHLPESSSVPQVFICAGTGFSPFRGFLQERHANGWKSVEKGGDSDAYLFFGCRSADYDFIYKDEIYGYLEDGTLTSMYLACSRQGHKRYVQHLLLQHAQLLLDLVENKGASVFICGAAGSMAADVRRTWERMTVQILGVSEDEAKEYLGKLEEEGRYNEDVWG